MAGRNLGTAEALRAPLLKIPDSVTEEASSLFMRKALGEN